MNRARCPGGNSDTGTSPLALVTRNISSGLSMYKGVLAQSDPMGLIAEFDAEPNGLQNSNVFPIELAACQHCAACCFSELARYVRVTGNDYARLGADAVAHVHFIENRAFMRLTDGHCGALEFEPDSMQFVCRVYENRPEVCRELERGSAACKGERQAKGERSLIFLRRKDSKA